jgi:hypothetical protein
VKRTVAAASTLPAGGNDETMLANGAMGISVKCEGET